MRNRRVNIKGILADPDLRHELMVATIQATQAREGINTSVEQASRAYYVVNEAELVACFALRDFRQGRGVGDARESAFVESLRSARASTRTNVPRRDFKVIDGAPLSFDKVQVLGPIFVEHPALGEHAQIHQGVITRDDTRFLRNFWEVTPRREVRPWVPLHKGGDFCRFYYDTDLVIDWDPRAQESMHRLRDTELYFREGLTWPLRTQRGLNVRKMEAGCVFSHKGGGILLGDQGSLFYVLGLLNSAFIEYVGRCLTSFGSWEVRVLRSMPVPAQVGPAAHDIARLAKAIHDAKACWDSGSETSTRFVDPWILSTRFAGNARSIPERLGALASYEVTQEDCIRVAYASLNDHVFRLFAIPEDTRKIIDNALAPQPPEVLWPEMEGKSVEQRRMEHIWRLLSHAVVRVVAGDDDGIVPFSAVNSEPRLVERVRHTMATLFHGCDANQVEVEVVNELKRTVKGYRRCASLEEWLDNVFFEYHCSLHKSRPILWHIASAQGTSPFAFGALVQYHRFDKNRMSKLRANYLRDAIEEFRREAGIADKAGRTEDRVEWQAKLEETQALDKKLQLIQEGHHEGAEGGDRDYRILTPWKKPNERPKGWDPDLDDGVKVNIEPLEKAGVLRLAKVT